jgi:hypothetical protein
MNKIKTALSIFTFLTLGIFAQGQVKVVDEFKIKKNKIKVIFYDPLLTLAKISDFEGKTDKEKSDLLDKHLHNNLLYLFIVTNSKAKEITYLCIRGNPEKVNTKMFYKVEVIKGISDTAFNPNNNYSDKIIKVIDDVNCGGTLFENMQMFADSESKKYIGNGIQLFGYYRRVQPYSEIKNSMKTIIEEL